MATQSKKVPRLPVTDREIYLAKQEIASAISQNGAKYLSCQALGIDWEVYKKWFARDRSFRKMVNRSLREFSEKVRDEIREEIHNRGVNGWTEPVFYRGERVDEVTKKSDACLLASAQANLPEYKKANQQANTVTVNIVNGISTFMKTIIYPLMKEYVPPDRFEKFRNKLREAAKKYMGK